MAGSTYFHVSFRILFSKGGHPLQSRLNASRIQSIRERSTILECVCSYGGRLLPVEFACHAPSTIPG
jgi:hypothetical protein